MIVGTVEGDVRSTGGSRTQQNHRINDRDIMVHMIMQRKLSQRRYIHRSLRREVVRKALSFHPTVEVRLLKRTPSRGDLSIAAQGLKTGRAARLVNKDDSSITVLHRFKGTSSHP
jgi:hypothetical protein